MTLTNNSPEEKAQEVAVMIIKAATYVRRKELKRRLEGLALRAAETVANQNMAEALAAVSSLISLIKIGKTIYEIEPINADLVLRELSDLTSAIKQFAEIKTENRYPSISLNMDQNNQDNEIGNGHSERNGNGNGITATIRQSAIMEKIRQFGKIALKEAIAVFPEVSERTLRYDLNKLCDQNTIERIGNGGPATYYVMKN